MKEAKEGLSEKKLNNFKKRKYHISVLVDDLETLEISEMNFGEEIVHSFIDNIEKIWEAIESLYIYKEYFYDEERFISFVKLIDIFEEMVIYMIKKMKEGD